MALLPGPDRPGGGSSSKPRRPKTTKGNVYTSKPPPKRNAKIVGRYKVKPTKIAPGLILKKRGGGLGYVTIRKPGAASSGAAPAAPAPPQGTVTDPSYPEYANQPWAQQQLRAIDSEGAYHQKYVNQDVAPWLSQSLTNLTGVDPAHPGINTTLQQQYLANVQGVVGGALNAAATAGPAQVASTTPGGVAGSPTAYLTGAAQQGAAGRASSMLQSAQIQSALNTMQPNTQAQGYVYAMADYAKGLPQVYATRRAEARVKIDQFIADQQQQAAQLAFDQAKFDEAARHNRVTESISATNSSTNAAFQAAQLGLKASDQAFGQQQDLTAASTPAPYGYNRDPATGKLVRDPSVATASSARSGGGGSAAPSAARGQYTANTLAKQGYVGGWKVKPKNVKGPFVKATNGRWYAKPKSGGGSASTTKPNEGKPAQVVYEKLTTAYDKGLISDVQSEGTPDLLRFLKPLQPSKGKSWDSWFADTLSAIGRVDPKYKQWIAGYVKRRIADGSWKGTF